VKADGIVEDIGIGNELPPALRALNADERMALSVLKMMGATFAPYAGAGGYQHARGGGLLLPADYRGLAALLLHSPETERTDSARLKAALLELISGGNELVVNTLTCLEREHARDTSDQFPEAAGGPSGMPSVTPDLVSAIDGSNGRASGLADVYGGPTGPGLRE